MGIVVLVCWVSRRKLLFKNKSTDPRLYFLVTLIRVYQINKK